MSIMCDKVASHYNSVPNSGIEERATSRIIHLRNFNNWMKSMLIADFLNRLSEEGCPSATVLDLCCGKGGDLQKWKIGKIKEILMTDVAEIALDHCRSRYQELRERFGRDRSHPFLAHFISADATKDILRDKYPDKDMKFDLCSCQFALHYSFASEETARRLLWNACDALRSGGYLIGTLPDANSIVRFLRRNGDGTFKNDVCRINYTDREVNFANHQPPLFGAQLNFELDKVVNCPEYLAYFPLLCKILEEFGMELVYSHSFPEAAKYYMGKNDKEGKSLMNRMKALEAFPPNNNENLAGDVSEYAHADEKYRQLNFADKNTKLGTLSKSEWEVASMYLVFAFRKK